MDRDPHPNGPVRAPLKLMVAGGCQADEATRAAAFETGREIARAGAALLCGGGGGVMSAAAEGARSEGGLTIGVMPGADADTSPPNPSIDIALFTGLGQARNVVLALSADAVIAIGGEWGTLSEIAIAMKHRRPVVLLDSWGLEPPAGTQLAVPPSASSPHDAVALALQLARSEGAPTA
jgi:uncharacterized protein (TIGR00725 family)